MEVFWNQVFATLFVTLAYMYVSLLFTAVSCFMIFVSSSLYVLPSGNLSLVCANVDEVEDCIQQDASVRVKCEARGAGQLDVELPSFAHATTRAQRVTGGKDFLITISARHAESRAKHCARASSPSQRQESCFTLNVCEPVGE